MRAFLFDLDDTLFDHRHSTRQALEAIRCTLPGLEGLSLDQLEERHGALLEQIHVDVLRGAMSVDEGRRTRLRRLVEQEGHIAREELIETAARRYRAAYLSARRPVPGAGRLLEALRAHGPIAVVTNNVALEQHGKIEVCGLRGLIDALVCSEEVGLVKPDPAIFRVALAKIRARAEDTLMVGDSWQADVLGARAAGIRAAWFNPRRLPHPEPGIVEFEFQGWEPLEAVLERLVQR